MGPSENREELRIVSPSGDTQPETITIPGARWLAPLDWSPDGSRILVSYGPASGGSALALVGVGSAGIENLDVTPFGWGYQFAGDGNALLCSARADGSAAPHDIFSRNLKTGVVAAIVDRVDLPSVRTTRIYPSVQGRRLIAHECARDGPFIYIQARLTPLSGQTIGQSDQIVRIHVAGGNERELFRAPQGQGITSTALSPDGKTLSIVTRLDRYHRALPVMPSDGGTPRQIHEFRQPSGGWVAHVWAPDGRSILYVQGPEDRTFFLRRVRVDKGQTAPETVYEQTGRPFFGLRFHPNGRLLAFTGRSDYSSGSEVWVIENLRDELDRPATPAKRP